jgi:hypothetical protein
MGQLIGVLVEGFRRTSGSWVAENDGDVVRAKDIVDRGPDCGTLHFEEVLCRWPETQRDMGSNCND